MEKTRKITKGCPRCNQEVFRACKACICGYLFYNERRKTQVPLTSKEPQRRSLRVNKIRPDFYNPCYYDKQSKKTKPRRNKSATKNKREKVKEDKTLHDIIKNLPSEILKQFSLILQEINRKNTSINWKP